MGQKDGELSKLTFDAREPNAMAVARQVFWNRLQADHSFTQIRGDDSTFDRYVDFARQRDREDFQRLIVDAFWEFVTEGIVSPGTVTGNASPPFFHLTETGKKTVRDPGFQPHDPDSFLRELGLQIPNPDATVLAYLRESLHCFAKRTFVASAMMLGIASERVFLLVCDSLLTSLASPVERTTFQSIVDRNPIKPKLDWVTQKFQQIQTPRRPAGWPDDLDIKLAGIFNLIRCQRNDLGHPRPAPPNVSRDDAYGYLRIFPSYYATAEQVRDYLSKNSV